MSTKMPQLQRTHINRTREVLKNQNGLSHYSTALILAQQMLSATIHVKQKGLLSTWHEIQELKHKFYELNDTYQVLSKIEYRELRYDNNL